MFVPVEFLIKVQALAPVTFNPINSAALKRIEMICIVVSFSLKNNKPIRAINKVLAPAQMALARLAGNDFNERVKK